MDRVHTDLDKEVVDLRMLDERFRTVKMLKIAAMIYKCASTPEITFGKFHGFKELANLKLHGEDSVANVAIGLVQSGKTAFQILTAITFNILSLYPFIFVLNNGGYSFVESFRKSITQLQTALFDRVQFECADFLDENDTSWRDVFTLTVTDTLSYGKPKGHIIKPGYERSMVVFIGNNNQRRIDILFNEHINVLCFFFYCFFRFTLDVLKAFYYSESDSATFTNCFERSRC